MPLDTSQLQTLRAFFWTAEGKLLVALLQGKLVESDEKLRRLSGEELSRQQGKSQQLFELIRELTEADQILKRQEQSRRPIARTPT